ncbi:MAG: multidrug ABC transporter ATP-binding protein [Flavobacteriales bacterium]|nr:multidrug ABC transporter ATP-binding protein [Flavobacteriales bacterium]
MVNKKNKFQLIKYILPYKWTFIIGLFFLFLSSVTSLLFPWLVGQLVDQSSNDITQVNKIGIMLFVLFLSQALFSYFRIILFIKVSSKAIEKLRNDTFSNLMILPLHFFSKRRVGEICSRITSDIEILKNTFTTDLAQFIRQIIIIIGGVLLLSFTSWKLTIFMMCTLPMIIVFAVIFGRKLRKKAKHIQNKLADANTILEESLQAISTIKSFTSEFFQINKYKKEVNLTATMSIELGKYRALFASFIIVGIFGSIVAVIWYGTILIQEGNMSIGELFSFILYSVFISASIGGIAELYASIQKAIGATEELLKIREEKGENFDNTNLFDDDLSVIKFKKIQFAYPSRKETLVLKNLSFEIKAGEKIAIVGASGSGKTTITKLLLNFYKCNEGCIELNNLNINKIGLRTLRQKIGIVSQDIILFATTIKDNLLIGNPNATDAEIVEAAKKANAHDFIMSFEYGYNTLVGERGVEISGGQRQRIAIARVILKNPDVLIFDEATSALDSKSEKIIQDSIFELLKERTSIIISHRISTIKKVDKILVLEDGAVVEQGSHSELIHLKGTYQKLASLQFDE